MLKKENKVNAKGSDELSGNSINLVGDSTRINGEVRTETDIRVDGNVNGDIITKGKLVSGESASIKGNIYCHSGDIAGKIEGNVYCKDMLHLKVSGRIDGDIYTKRLVVEKDAGFNGQCEMKENVVFPWEEKSEQKSDGANNEHNTGKTAQPRQNGAKGPESSQKAEKREKTSSV